MLGLFRQSALLCPKAGLGYLRNKYTQCPDRPRHVSTCCQQARGSKSHCLKCPDHPNQTSTISQHAQHSKSHCLKCPDHPNQASIISQQKEHMKTQCPNVPGRRVKQSARVNPAHLTNILQKNVPCPMSRLSCPIIRMVYNRNNYLILFVLLIKGQCFCRGGSGVVPGGGPCDRPWWHSKCQLGQLQSRSFNI